MNILSVKNLKKGFKRDFWRKKIEVLNGVSFEIEQGRLTGFLGSNGSGKTTTIKALLGLIFPDSGSIRFFDSPLLTKDIRRRIGFLPERPYFYEYLTGVEFLKFHAQLTGMSVDKVLQERMDELFEMVNLTHSKNKTLKSYSKGMLQRIGILQALVHDPDLIILDEPMAGLDPDGRSKISEVMKRISDSGKTIFFSSHLLHDVELICDNLVIIGKMGKVIYQGSMKAFLEELQSGFILYYFYNGKEHKETFSNLQDLQDCIDKVRGQQGIILKVVPERPSLEKAFLNLSE